MNEYQSSRLVDILPPPAVSTGTDSGTIFYWIIAFLLLAILFFFLSRSKFSKRVMLRWQIQQQKIDAHDAANRMLTMNQNGDQALQQELLQLRFGSHIPDRDRLLSALDRCR